jgi:cell division septation protein DedD
MYRYRMDTPDKNAHLSPLLSAIKDYGPGDGPSEADAEPSDRPSPDSNDHSPDVQPLVAEAIVAERSSAHPMPPSGGVGGSRWAIYGLVLLWLLTLGAGFAAFVWQQTRVDELKAQRDAEQRSAQSSIAAAEGESARLSERLMTLESEALRLRTALADAQQRPVETTDVDPAAPPEKSSSTGMVRPDSGQSPVEPAAASAETAAESEATPREATGPGAGSAVEQTAKPLQTPVAGPDPDGWFVNLSTFSTEALASRWLAQLPGPPANTGIVAVERGGKTLYRVRIGGFGSLDEAQRAADRAIADWNLESAWISRG